MSKLAIAFAVTAAAITTPAAAVTVVGATHVVITNALPTWLQVAEVQAVTFGSVNVAAAANGGSATGSAEYQNNGFATPGKAIDGNTGGNYYSDFIYHSGTTGGDQFLQVAFAAPSTLASLTLFGRSDCCHDRDVYNYAIYAGETLLTSGSLDTTQALSGTVTFDAPSIVPEAATWAMMIAGFGLVGVSARQRRRARAVVAA